MLQRTLKINDYFSRMPLTGMAMQIVHYADETVSPHEHDFYELIVIRSGDGCHRIGSLEYPIYPGEVFFLQPGVLHSFSEFSHLTLLNFMFRLDSFQQYYERLEALTGFRTLIAPLKNGELLMLDDTAVCALGLLVDRISSEQVSRSPGFHIAVELSLCEALLCIARNLHRVGRDNIKSLKMAGVLDFIAKNLTANLSLTHLAGVAGMSLTHFRRSFKEATGLSPVQYLLRLRVSKAQELLTGSSLSLAEIAADTGFGNVNYFSRQFTHVAGISPGAYRKSDHGVVHTPGLDLREKLQIPGKLHLRKL